MSITDALTRISEIQQQITTLTGASTSTNTSADTSTAAQSSTTGSSTSATQFAQALAEAQSADGSSTDGTTESDSSELSSLLASAGTGSTSGSSELSSLLASAGTGSTSDSTALTSLDSDLSTSASTATAVSGGSGLASSSTSALSSTASSELTSDQQQFASTLVADTGLNPNVVSAWLLAEENGGAAQSRQAASNNDWLNIGYTDSGTDGASDQVWSDPVSAANATAGWLKGQDSIPGYGTASSSIQSILGSVGQAPAAQITALQNSGWASSGYPDLDDLYQQVSGS